MPFDRPGFDRLSRLVVDALTCEALRPQAREPQPNAEGDAELLDRLRIIVGVLVLPHRRRNIQDVTGLPRNHAPFKLGVALALDRIDDSFEVLVAPAMMERRLDEDMRD